MAQISVDGETGDIKGIQRIPTGEDQLYMTSYLEYLEKEFEKKEDKEPKQEPTEDTQVEQPTNE